VNELALFAGAGGGILGGHLLGWRTVCAVEWEPYPASVLCARQNDGFLPPFPVWDDVQTFDGKPWRGIVDVVSGGFPCQDISAAGKGEGIDGERSGMWREMARIIHEVRPRFVFVENSPMLTSRGLGTVLGDLASMGFNARWGVLGAADVGAPHRRDRIWITGWRDVFPHAELHRLGWREQQSEGFEKKNVAHTDSLNDAMRGNGQDYEKSMGIRGDESRGSVSHSGPGCQEGAGESKSLADTTSIRPSGQGQSEQSVNSAENGNRKTGQSINVRKSSFWAAEPDVGRVADGVAARVDRLKAIGNGQVSEVARRAWEILGDKG
jgi:DNA (cytosine-5)-methyltransferase 1